MKTTLISLLMFLFLLPLVPFSVMAAQDSRGGNMIEKTCKNTPYYQLCVSTLRSNPRSSGADLAGLGLILVDAAKAKATNAVNNMEKLIKSQPKLKNPLKQCAESYYMILSIDIPEAVEALSKGNPKFAEDGMSDVARETEDCEKSFVQSKSPLTAINKAVHDLSLVTTSIIRMLL